MAKKVGVLIRKNKSGNTFYCRLWYPPTKNSRNITLGKETETFTDVQATERLKVLKDHFKRENYDYKTILKKLDEDEKPKVSDLTLNEVAHQYFDKLYERNKTDFLNEYKDRFDFKHVDDVEENPVFKKRKKHLKSHRNYYRNHVEVQEWVLKQEKTRNGKPKEQLTKVGIKKYTKIGKSKIVDVSKQDIETWMTGIQNKLNIAQKTKHNLISQLRTIFNFAVTEEYIEKSPFDKIKKEQYTKNPHNYRERLLDPDEMSSLMKELYNLENKNSFNAAVLGLALGARANSVLNIKKSDFHENDKEFLDAYIAVEIINFKTQGRYTLPLIESVGRYFYYLLQDYEDYEYVIRPKDEKRRTHKPMVEIPKEFRLTTDRTVNATDEVRELYSELEDNTRRIKEFKELSFEHDKKNDRAGFFIKRWSKRSDDIKKDIKKLKKEYLADKKHYLKMNFSFHNFRHQLVSLTSIYNPLYAKRILNHSSDRSTATTERYIKSDIEKIKAILEKALQQYTPFLIPIIEEVSNSYDYEELKRQFKSKAFAPKAKAYGNRKDVFDVSDQVLRYIVEHTQFDTYDLEKMTRDEIIDLEHLAEMKYKIDDDFEFTDVTEKEQDKDLEYVTKVLNENDGAPEKI